MAHVLFQTVNDVAAVHGLAAAPLRAEQTGQQTLLHTVLRPYAENVLHPHSADAKGKLAQDEHRHEAHCPVDAALTNARCRIDGALHGPHRGKA